MRILNLTHSPLWYPQHFDRVLQETGHTGETMFRSEGNFNAEKANQIWRECREYFESFDAIFVSHLATWSRVFLQNGWQKPLYVWVSFRFDHDVDDLPEYHKLILDSTNHKNVKFFAMSQQDRLYARDVLHDFPIDVVSPFIFDSRDGKPETACGTDRFFLVGKHNETLFANQLDKLGIPMYTHLWESGSPYIKDVRGILHFPYVCTTRSLFENLAAGNVYFLPSHELIQDLFNTPGYFWDRCREPLNDYSQTEWYRDGNKKLFVYYDSFEELRDMSNSPNFDDLLEAKTDIVMESVRERNTAAKRQWREILA